MKALVIGAAGKMGRAVVHYLANDPAVTQIGALDIQEEGLKSIARQDKTGKMKVHKLDVHDRKAMKETMGEYDVGVATLPNRKVSYDVMETAVEAGMHLVDILEEYHRRPDKYETEGFEISGDFKSLDAYGEWLHEKAVDNDVLVLDGMGFAPGLSNITSAQGIRTLDKAHTVFARVGGIPDIECCEKHPLRYMTTWSLEHVLREYSVKTQIMKGGKVIEVQALADRERFRFNKFEVDVDLECAVTPGMPSFIYTYPDLSDFAEKTVRWPGHYDGIRTLIECGLFEEAPVEFNGAKISPREFLLSMINPRLVPQEGEGDVCIMYNTVIGEKDGNPHKVEYFMWEQANEAFTAMARVTGFPAAIGAVMIGMGKIDARGIRAPEECFEGENYRSLLNALEACDINIAEEIQTLST
jgi:saccharopine dehydrogenase-like NADP-dependent oxidoreductase